MLIPVAAVIAVHYRWRLGAGRPSYAALRMVAQLLLIGFLLTYIFAANKAWPVCAVLAFMLVAASWISLNASGRMAGGLFLKAGASIATGGLPVLALVVWGVLRVRPWYGPRFIIPLAGMILAGAMNSVSLAAERFFSEVERGRAYEDARDTAYRASLIPVVNSFLAVGLVQLPGMMTGQILAGVEPLVAVRYQIMVMGMLLGSAGLASACFLSLLRIPSPTTALRRR